MKHPSLCRASALTLVLASTMVAAGQADSRVFRSDAARLELHKPSGWHTQSLESVQANRASVKLNDAEFQKAVEKMSSAPILVATKHAEPYETLNPTFQVIVRPAGPFEGKSGVEIIRLVESTLKEQFDDFKAVDKVHETSVAGKRAGRMTIRYTLKTQDGREFPTQATLVMIPRGKILYQLGFSGPPEGPDAFTTEVDAVLTSVKFLE